MQKDLLASTLHASGASILGIAPCNSNGLLTAQTNGMVAPSSHSLPS